MVLSKPIYSPQPVYDKFTGQEDYALSIIVLSALVYVFSVLTVSLLYPVNSQPYEQ